MDDVQRMQKVPLVSEFQGNQFLVTFLSFLQAVAVLLHFH